MRVVNKRSSTLVLVTSTAIACTTVSEAPITDITPKPTAASASPALQGIALLRAEGDPITDGLIVVVSAKGAGWATSLAEPPQASLDWASVQEADPNWNLPALLNAPTAIGDDVLMAADLGVEGWKLDRVVFTLTADGHRVQRVVEGRTTLGVLPVGARTGGLRLAPGVTPPGTSSTADPSSGVTFVALTGKEVAAVIDYLRPDIGACATSEAQVVVSFVVQGSGLPEKIEATGGPSAVNACVARVFSVARFPAPCEPTPVKVPLKVKP